MANINFNALDYEDTNNGSSKLKAIADDLRPQFLATNPYNNKDPFSTSHPNAIADGDRLGREPNGSGEPGTSEDIQKRKEMLATNKFTSAKPYRLSE